MNLLDMLMMLYQYAPQGLGNWLQPYSQALQGSFTQPQMNLPGPVNVPQIGSYYQALGGQERYDPGIDLFSPYMQELNYQPYKPTSGMLDVYYPQWRGLTPEAQNKILTGGTLWANAGIGPRGGFSLGQGDPRQLTGANWTTQTWSPSLQLPKSGIKTTPGGGFEIAKF